MSVHPGGVTVGTMAARGARLCHGAEVRKEEEAQIGRRRGDHQPMRAVTGAGRVSKCRPKHNCLTNSSEEGVTLKTLCTTRERREKLGVAVNQRSGGQLWTSLPGWGYMLIRLGWAWEWSADPWKEDLVARQRGGGGGLSCGGSLARFLTAPGTDALP
ncbi:hypothetical protein AAFF_G00016680 [Aldrovandia affinis]|uniref:Uncharacterized protein n=1 Tax=Aldrovandia affinis TaxID=143900 RepID=A0AAD7S5X3_9TELE|nr:hypothetical protein AAFF_G00016680 [Aldrovandia affinis]